MLNFLCSQDCAPKSLLEKLMMLPRLVGSGGENPYPLPSLIEAFSTSKPLPLNNPRYATRQNHYVKNYNGTR